MRLRMSVLAVIVGIGLVVSAEDMARFEWGFETDKVTTWTSWGQKDGKSYCDSKTVHGGSHSMRLEPSGNKRLMLGNRDYVPLKPDTNYTLSGWVKSRGTHWAQVGGILRDAEGKYIADDNIWTVRMLGSKDWVKLQTGFNSGGVALFEPVILCAGEGGAAWFDDVCLEEGLPLESNEFPNSAFTICSTLGYPDMWGVSLTDPMTVRDWEDGDYYRIDPNMPGPVPDVNVLRFRIPETGLRFGPFRAKLPAGTYTCSVYLKSSSGNVSVSVAGFKTRQKPFVVSKEWQRYSFTAERTSARTNHTFSLKGPGTLWLAAPQLQSGDQLTDWCPSAADLALTAAGCGASETSVFVRKQADIPRVEAGPTIDGRLDDACWQSAWEAPAFVDNTSGLPVSLGCKAWAACDENNIYIAFKNAEPIAARRHADRVGDDSVSCFKPDSNEVFIAPGGNSDYFHLAVNPTGDLYDEMGYSSAWASNATVATCADDEGWNVEISMPVSALETPGDDTGWSINLCRNRNDDKGITHYSAAAGANTFHKPHRFMTIARMPIKPKTWNFISPKVFDRSDKPREFFVLVRSPGNAGESFVAELSLSSAPDQTWRQKCVMTAAGTPVSFSDLPMGVDPDVEAQLNVYVGERKDTDRPIAKLKRKILHLKSPYDPASPVMVYAKYSNYPLGANTAKVKVGTDLDGPSQVRLTLEKNGEALFTEEVDFPGPGEQVVEIPLAGLSRGAYELWGAARQDGETRAWAGDRFTMVTPKKNVVRMNRFTRCFVCDDKPYFPLLFHPFAGRETPEWVFDAALKDGYNGLEVILPLIGKDSAVSERHFPEIFQRATARDMKIFFRLDHRNTGSFDKLTERCCQLAAKAKDHPSMVEYYIKDEPSVRTWEEKDGYRESDLLRLANAMRQVDPHHPVTINYTESHMQMNHPVYGGFDATDFYIYDCYPNMQIRAEPLEHFAEVAHRWNDVLSKIGRCVCVWLPVWGGFDAVRTPTPDEWQNMALVSVISGTRGLLNWMELPYTVPLIKRIREVNQQLQRICPMIIAEDTRTEKDIQGSIHYAVWINGRDICLMAANSSSSAAGELDLNIDALVGEKLSLLQDVFATDIAFTHEGGTVRGSFPPCKSGIFKFVRTEP